ncbi:peptidoglycan-binding domain-containing protein [Streptomyces sp. 43Y-GA-1]|uniref:peptidoglycan-binding domain-containing protein n=1 Tax=Streptomyces sp. 43Y-GA-1 TaxID=2939435 RepID=UPI0020C0950D|nr:peptidoglycan-binding domain-containing protein [Streptomyces sp. 43Y-GA-1]MCL6286862.1 peptidoglycan-binding protein [Streptomyces sp. 43Y-GA-1]
MPCRCGAGAGAAPLTEDEQRAARTAEIAAAEDFDPLRIRPYVTLTDLDARAGGGGLAEPGGSAATSGPGTSEAATAPVGTPSAPGAAETTMPLFLGDDGPGVGVGTGVGSGMDTGTGTVAGASAPAGPGGRRRSAGAEPAFAPDPVQPRRRRPFGALAVGAAVAAVVGTAAFAGGLFDGDDSRDEALPEATTSVPDTEGEPAASVAPSPSASAAPSRTPSASATPSASPSASAAPTRSQEPTPTATASASPTASAPATPDGGGGASSAPPAEAPPAELAGPSLRPGDRGPEVAELQNRLMEVWLYSGPSDANYNGRVENAVAVYQSYKAIQGDPAGVYGPNTRRALEAETSGRGRR